jgi:hypothetical protein
VSEAGSEAGGEVKKKKSGWSKVRRTNRTQLHTRAPGCCLLNDNHLVVSTNLVRLVQRHARRLAW